MLWTSWAKRPKLCLERHFVVLTRTYLCFASAKVRHFPLPAKHSHRKISKIITFSSFPILQGAFTHYKYNIYGQTPLQDILHSERVLRHLCEYAFTPSDAIFRQRRGIFLSRFRDLPDVFCSNGHTFAIENTREIGSHTKIRSLANDKKKTQV